MVYFLYNPEMSFCSNLLNRKSNYFSLSLFLMRKDWFPGTRSLERLLLQDNKKISFDSVFDLFPSPHYHFSIFLSQLIQSGSTSTDAIHIHGKSETESGLFSCAPLFVYSPWNSPGQNTGEGGPSLLQGIFPTQGSNSRLPHCRQILYQLSHTWEAPFAFLRTSTLNMADYFLSLLLCWSIVDLQYYTSFSSYVTKSKLNLLAA